MNCGIKALLDGVYFVYDRKVFCLSVNGDRGCCTQWFEGRDQVIHSGCVVSKYNLFYPIFPVGWQMILAQNIIKNSKGTSSIGKIQKDFYKTMFAY